MKLKVFVAVALMALPGSVVANDWGRFYGEIYGGGHIPGTSTFTDIDTSQYSYDMDAGGSFGASMGILTPVPGLAFELDIMKVISTYADSAALEAYLDTLSVMVNVEYGAPVGDMFELYGAVGVGGIEVDYENNTPFQADGWGWGYQLALGARANVSESVAISAEYKHQATAGDINTGVYGYGIATNNFLVGLRLSN